MLKKLAIVALVACLPSTIASAATQTHSKTCSNGESFSNWWYINATASVQFNTEAYAWGTVSGGTVGVAGLYERWWDSDPFTSHPSSVSQTANAAAGTYMLYVNMGSNPGGTSYMSTTATW